MNLLKPRPVSISTSLLVIAALAAMPSPARAQWSSNPAQNLAIADYTGDQAVPKIAADNNGGTWLAWFDQRGGSYAVYAQHLDVQGHELFVHGGLLVSNQPQNTSLVDWDLISDGGAGCVLAFTDTRAGGDLDAYAYRIDGMGTETWGANGVALSNNADFEANPKLARLSDGSFVCVWSNSPNTGAGSIRIQKLDANGNPQYVADGIHIDGAGSEKPGFASVVAADNGGYVVSWTRDLSFTGSRHLRTQKFDANGNALWNGGTPIAVYDFNSLSLGYQSQLLSDGAGGAVYGWHRSVGSTFDVLVQRVSSGGTELFAHNGVAASNDASTMKLDPAIAFLQASGDTIVIFDKRNSAQSMWSLSAQRISAAGTRLWTDNALDVMPLDATVKSIERCVPYGNGALAFCFYQPVSTSQNEQLLGFRLDANGNSIWPTSPLVVSSVLAPKQRMGVVVDGTSVARLVWDDGRTDIGDTYAQNVNAGDGTLGNTSTCGATTYCIAAPNTTSMGAPISWSGSTSLRLNDFMLLCGGLPTTTTGIFFYGSGQTQTPFGDGYRCVSGSTFRLGPPIHADPGGTVSRFLDLTQPPASSGPGTISAGSTWNFQFWYRNVGGPMGTGFNLSNGLRATFCP